MKVKLNFPIYLDNQATTPLDHRVFNAMVPYLRDRFGNPHSSDHCYGWQAAEAIEIAREQIANLINAEKSEIIFTSGATETNNLVIKGIAESWRGKPCDIILPPTEHRCVINSCHHVEKWGARILYAPVKTDGTICLKTMESLITKNTRLITAMAVNNEIGVIQPLLAIGQICSKHNFFFHSDIAQAFGKIPLDVKAINFSFLSISGHKIYGPKGIGALYVRKGLMQKLTPQMDGGNQEHGLRSGTLSPALCVGLGKASEIAKKEMDQEARRIKEISKTFLEILKKNIPQIRLNGSSENRWWGNLNIIFPGYDGNEMISKLKKIAVSSASACASSNQKSSYVLYEIGVSTQDAKSSLRIGFGRFTTLQEAVFAAQYIGTVLKGKKTHNF